MWQEDSFTNNPNYGDTDSVSLFHLAQIAESQQVSHSCFEKVIFILVILSAKGMPYSIEFLMKIILCSYPNSVIFFQTTSGQMIKAKTPEKIDLVVDFTGPRQRQKKILPRQWKNMTRFIVGRNWGSFRKHYYDRVLNEASNHFYLPEKMLQYEKWVQRKVLGLAGIGWAQTSEIPKDQGKTIARTLPRLLFTTKEF